MTLPAPFSLRCDHLRYPHEGHVTTSSPIYSWASTEDQSAYQIRVFKNTSDPNERELIWDSEKTESTNSINITHSGENLEASIEYDWSVRIWNSSGEESPWSQSQTFSHQPQDGVSHERLRTSRISASRLEARKDLCFIDFAKAAFATLEVDIENTGEEKDIFIHLGESLHDKDTLEKEPPGTVRYRKCSLKVPQGRNRLQVSIPADEKNTRANAIKMPEELFEVLPFRYAEIETASADIQIHDAVQIAVHYTFDESASSFNSDNEILNQVWELCKYSIKATSFCGLYVDGDRERIPYEGDAYINQLSHYGVDAEYSIARRTLEHFIHHPSWPTEWILYTISLAWYDYIYTGDKRLLQKQYPDLQAKSLRSLSGESGLISTHHDPFPDDVLEAIHRPWAILKDLVDWPPRYEKNQTPGECDDHEMMPLNSVVNALYYHILTLMSDISKVLDKEEEEVDYRKEAEKVYAAYQEQFYDENSGLYLDGQGSTHSSLHANMFPLCFGLVPDQHRPAVIEFIKSRDMACSVYGAQILLDALYLSGESGHALDLMTAKHDRGWWHMLELGSTVTLEAWDVLYKKNLDWNHAWGSAPANIIPRYIAGVRPLTPGFEKILIEPQPAILNHFDAKVPTIMGPVELTYHKSDKGFKLELLLPGNTRSILSLKYLCANIHELHLDGEKIRNEEKLELSSGKHVLEIRSL